MRRAALLLILVPVLAGCAAGGGTSTSEFSGAERDVADAIADFTTNASRSEESQACSESLSAELRDSIAADGESCPSELEKVFDDADASSIDIQEITVTGTDATAEIEIEDGDDTFSATWELVEEDGDWRVDSFGSVTSSS